MSLSLGEIAARFGCELHGDPDAVVGRVATLANAGEDALSFLANPAYRTALADTKAGAVLLSADEAEACPVPALVCADPYVTYARVATLLYPPHLPEPGVSAAASVDESARIPASASVGPGARIGPGVVLGEHAAVGPNCVVERDCSLGEGTRLVASVTLCRGVSLGARCLIHPGAVIGADGFGIARAPEGWIKVPQVGSVTIGDDVEIGANSCVDRGAIEDTVIGDGVRIDNLVQIAHNVRIGEHSALAAMVGIAGSTEVGRRCLFGGASGAVGHVKIADDVILGGRCMVTSDIRKPGMYGSAMPHQEIATYRRNVARFRQIDRMARRLKQLEKALGIGRGIGKKGSD
jgi:UDP-3-O-[3-hydroxymyristoyl] glucosamine N-acyltransferase